MNTNRLFVQNSGKDMAGATISDWLTKFVTENNFKSVTAHGLRHSYISMLVASGENPKVVSELAGHADIQTTLKFYTHTNFEAKRKAASKINDLLKFT